MIPAELPDLSSRKTPGFGENVIDKVITGVNWTKNDRRLLKNVRKTRTYMIKIGAKGHTCEMTMPGEHR